MSANVSFPERPQFSTQTHQKFKIDGFKFFQGSLNSIREIIASSDKQPSKTIPSASLAAFIGAHSLCHEDGMLPADFNFALLAKTTKCKYDSIRKGFQWLLEHGFIARVHLEETVHYKIVGYEEYNNSRSEKPSFLADEKGLSYFYVPFAVFTEGVLENLVHNKDTSGIITMLEFANYFTRQLQYSKDEVSDYSCVRKMSYLKSKLRRKPHKIREYMNNTIGKLFNIEMVVKNERKPRDIQNRKRKPVTQVVVDQVNLKLTDVCVRLNDDMNKIREKIANFRKNIKYVLKYNGRKLTTKDMKDVQFAFSSEVGTIMSYIENQQERESLYQTVYGIVCRNIDNETKNGSRIDNVGGFIRNAIRKAIDYWKNDSMTRSVAMDVAARYAQEHGEYPSFMKRQ